MSRFFAYIMTAIILLVSILLPAYANYTPKPEKYSLHRVEAGETLWRISERYNPDADPRIAVEWIREANSMPADYMIQPGDVVNVPNADGVLMEPWGPTYTNEEAAIAAEIEYEKLFRPTIEEMAPEERKTASRGVTPQRGREMQMEATAYTWTGHRTATGVWPEVGMVAVDPDVIPLGSRLWVEGYGEAVATDTGGDIKGMRIDVYLDTEKECFKWGRKMVKVVVFE